MELSTTISVFQWHLRSAWTRTLRILDILLRMLVPKVMVAANAKLRECEDGSITENRILEIKLELECLVYITY